MHMLMQFSLFRKKNAKKKNKQKKTRGNILFGGWEVGSDRMKRKALNLRLVFSNAAPS